MKSHINNLTLDAFFAALIAICAQIAFPAAVPFTMQTFAVCLSIIVLGAKHALVSMSVYLAIGLAGAPVFSMFRGGISVFLTPNAGYIIGFFVMIALYGLVPRRFLKNRISVIICLFAALLSCYAFGTLWYILILGSKQPGFAAIQALSCCVVPFVIPDIVKIIAAVYVGVRLKKYNIKR